MPPTQRSEVFAVWLCLSAPRVIYPPSQRREPQEQDQ